MVETMNSNGPTPKFRDVKPASPANDGFDGRLRCASLADLVQMECLSGARVSVAVTSNGRRGHLFFDGGNLVYATTAQLHGEEAALEILGWSTGSFGDSERPWPTGTPIALVWQQLLIMAAQVRDEKLRDDAEESLKREESTKKSASRLVALSTVRPPPPASIPPPSSIALPRGATRPPQKPPVKPPGLRGAAMDGAGNVLSQEGDVGELPDLAAYLQQLAGLIGEDLGLSDFKGLQWERATSRVALYTGVSGRLTVLEGPSGTDLTAFRAALES